jgi:hypothetical protein
LRMVRRSVSLCSHSHKQPGERNRARSINSETGGSEFNCQESGGRSAVQGPVGCSRKEEQGRLDWAMTNGEPLISSFTVLIGGFRANHATMMRPGFKQTGCAHIRLVSITPTEPSLIPARTGNVGLSTVSRVTNDPRFSGWEARGPPPHLLHLEGLRKGTPVRHSQTLLTKSGFPPSQFHC